MIDKWDGVEKAAYAARLAQQAAGSGEGVVVVPGKAAGGPVMGGKPYLVGERGPELIVPGMDSYVVPNHRLGGGAGGSSATTVNVGGITIVQQPGQDAKALAREVNIELGRMARSLAGHAVKRAGAPAR